MTKDDEKLIRSLKELGKIPAIIEPATVKSVDATALTCVVELADETEITDVRLKAAIDEVNDGIVQIPVVGSTVLVGSIGNKVNVRVVIMFSTVTEVLFYGGTNGGLTKIGALVTKLNNLENKMNDLIAYINTHSHAANGSPPAPTYAGGNLTVTQQGDLENTKVKH